MFDFDEELEKFRPSLEVEQAEEAINNNNLEDVADMVKELLQELR